ncbi:MAG: bifunctional glutamate N-acetyltransferase/amino-acid acetyltransferase ArgJ [Armatimonadota bacterium]|nr:bifunctional glutamate N-acetyltransferase/amino-acid acetyltransferase ArgJ [Armatimonadota bacterium]
MQRVDGGVTAPKGFRAAGVRCGIKQAGPDLMLLASDVPATAAGVFTTNAVKAAPVLLSRERIDGGTAQVVIANSGNANACTGAQGMADADRMTELVASALRLNKDEVLVASTGIIGQHLPMEKIETGIAVAVAALSFDGGDAAARAIMTTDTRPKSIAVEFETGGKSVRIGGMCKGVGMLAPNMATMLAFITTDAKITPRALRKCLARSAEISFNCVTVDGDMSTNDSAFILANGMAENPVIDGEGPDTDEFQAALDTVTVHLAREIARDGEGATKLVEICVNGAATADDARSVAITIANSPLVKTAIFGRDPNWGRVLAAAGRAGAQMDPDKTDLYFGDVRVFEQGEPTRVDAEEARRPMLADELVITVELNIGEASAKVWTCDFSYDYVKINAEYHT